MLTGCWSRIETNELAIPDGYAVDWNDGTYRITVSAFNPRSLGQPGEPAPNPNQPSTIFLTGTGTTVGAAISDVDNATSRRVLWGSPLLVLVGESLARHGIDPLLDAITHQPYFRPTPRIIIVHGDARTLLALRKSTFETSISRTIQLNAVTLHRQQSFGWAPHVWDVIRWEDEQQRTPLILAIHAVSIGLVSAPVYSFSDSAVLRGGRLVAWMPRDDVRGALWLNGQFVHGDVGVACPGTPGRRGQVRIIQAQRWAEPVIAGGRLTAFAIRVTGAGSVLQTCPPTPMAGSLAHTTSASVAAMIRSAVAWAQGQDADVFGWGESVYRHDPGLWRALAPRWPQTFAHLPVRLTVAIRVPQPGLTK